jgi:hypothetical protein
LGGKKGCLPGPAKCLRWPLAALLIRPPAFFPQQSPSTYGHSRIFFSIFIFISGGDQKLLFPSYSPLQNSLLGRKSIPGEMAVRINKNVKNG